MMAQSKAYLFTLGHPDSESNPAKAALAYNGCCGYLDFAHCDEVQNSKDKEPPTQCRSSPSGKSTMRKTTSFATVGTSHFRYKTHM